MKIKYGVQIFGTVLLMAAIARGEEHSIASLVDTNKMAQLLGKHWAPDRGLVIEGEKDIEKLPAAEKQAAEVILKTMKPFGVIASGEFLFSRTQAPLDSLSIRIFKFASPEKATEFRKTKYDGDAAKPLYKKTESKAAITYDSLQMKKRIMFVDTYWITCGHIGDDDQHLKVLDACLKLNTKQQP